MAALDAGVPLRDVQLAARHCDPRTTTVYDRRRENFDRHAAYVVVAFVRRRVTVRHFEDWTTGFVRRRSGAAPGGSLSDSSPVVQWSALVSAPALEHRCGNCVASSLLLEPRWRLVCQLRYGSDA
jgi:hypothetical protein